jgi:hypothetical protein
MRLRSISLTADSVALRPVTGTSARKTTDIPKFLTIVQAAELLAVSSTGQRSVTCNGFRSTQVINLGK